MANPGQKSNKIYNLPLAVYTGTHEPMSIRDPIYPRKSEVHCGSVFMFHGHSVEYPTLWTVQEIFTLYSSESGRTVQSSVYNVRLLDDIVVLQCDRPFQQKRIIFRTLSYSAAWRLEE